MFYLHYCIVMMHIDFYVAFKMKYRMKVATLKGKLKNNFIYLSRETKYNIIFSF